MLSERTTIRLLAGGTLVLACLLLPASARADCVHQLHHRGSHPVGSSASGIWRQVAELVQGRTPTPYDPIKEPAAPTQDRPCGPGMNCGGTQDHAPVPTIVSVDQPDALTSALEARLATSFDVPLALTSHHYAFLGVTALDPPPRAS